MSVIGNRHTTSISLRKETSDLIDLISRKLGLESRSDVIRFAVHKLAREEGLAVEENIEDEE